MNTIQNKNIPVLDLEHTYVVDKGDDNAERHMLQEAFVNQVAIECDKAEVTFSLWLADGSKDVNPENVTIYYDVDSYRATGKSLVQPYDQILNLLKQMGVPEMVLEAVKGQTTSGYYIQPTGYIIDENLMIQRIDFPDKWVFKRKLKKETDADNKVTSITITDWEHNANFNGKALNELYATRADALKNHKIRVQRLTGDEEEV